jgi:hypothetical protein
VRIGGSTTKTRASRQTTTSVRWSRSDAVLTRPVGAVVVSLSVRLSAGARTDVRMIVGVAALTVSVSVAVRLTPLPRVTDSEKVSVPGAVRENACEPRVTLSAAWTASVALRDAPLPPVIDPSDSENVIVSEVARARAVDRAMLSASVTRPRESALARRALREGDRVDRQRAREALRCPCRRLAERQGVRGSGREKLCAVRSADSRT